MEYGVLLFLLDGLCKKSFIWRHILVNDDSWSYYYALVNVSQNIKNFSNN